MGVDIAALVAKNLGRYGAPLGVKDCTLIKVTSGALTPGQYSGAPALSEVPYAASGLIELLTVNDAPAPLVVANDRKISLLGAAIDGGQIPAPGDKVTIEDLDGTTVTLRLISPIEGDGVGAMYSFIARK
jgi:hypothetical protein